ncbi:MAG: beta-lactamase family protein, partial [Bacteroidales bacterium]|nr:beta-lactamase family protein [Bacteroidales bacterium]
MKYSLIAGIAASALLLMGCSSSNNNSTAALEKQLDSIATAWFPEGEPGAAILVVKGDEIIFDKGYGIADIESGAKIDGDTFFNIASCSKQFTAVAALQLVQKGLISLSDPMGKYFPEYTDPLWQKVTVAHLLSHSSGIPDLRGYLTREAKVNGDEDLATEYLATLDHLNFEPGTDYEYINPTFVLIGKLVERVSGMEFTQYVHDNIFVPSGMNETLYFDRNHQDLIPRMSHGYEYADVEDMPEERTAAEGKSSEPKNWYQYDFGEETFFATRPDGGIYTSTHELVKWEKSIRNNTVLSEELFNDAFTPHTLVSGSVYSDYQNRPGTYYGYGWFIEPEKGVVYHTGDNGGFKILVARYPKEDALCVILW